MTWQLYQVPHLSKCRAQRIDEIHENRLKSKAWCAAFADALLVVPKTLAENGGFDVMDTIIGKKPTRRLVCLAV